MKVNDRIKVNFTASDISSIQDVCSHDASSDLKNCIPAIRIQSNAFVRVTIRRKWLLVFRYYNLRIASFASLVFLYSLLIFYCRIGLESEKKNTLTLYSAQFFMAAEWRIPYKD